MYTRSRQSQGYANARNQNNSNVGYQGQNTYNQQGGFQGLQPSSNQQSNYKQGSAQNSQPFKSQTQQQPQMQQIASRNLQQGKPQQQQQQQQQQQPQQQMKQQQQQQPIASSPQIQQQPQPQPQPIPQSQSQTQPQLQTQAPPQRLKPILKQTSHVQQQAAPIVQNNPAPPSQPLVPTPTLPLTTNSIPTPPISNNTGEIKAESEISEITDMEIQEQQPRWRRKAPGFRVNKRLKRLRLNQRLRKTLQPKNAIMVLNEMKAGVQFTFPETQGMPNSLYLVHAELDGKTYVGQGLSKPLARQNAAENALKALLLEKMTAASMKARIDAETDGQTNQPVEATIIQLKDDGTEEVGTPMDTNTDESDEIPWSSLASFALYKLFLEWHNQGTSVPVPRPGLPSPVKGIKREISAQAPKTPVQKELPPNAINIHPVMLLNQMRPGLTYVELNRVGNPPNTMFTLAVDIDGIEYTGTARNKKDAKKIAAKSALLALYDLSYPDEKLLMQEQPMA
ncbi:uncharacterized protein LOC143148075 [Ptiloglossa arizonensis]|uniref:uncharacterized protein LOC143148075 n=1 Tax=Ptiloglossa arizonensis TaxID=3350558 RepID=UPI003FA18439